MGMMAGGNSYNYSPPSRRQDNRESLAARSSGGRWAGSSVVAAIPVQFAPERVQETACCRHVSPASGHSYVEYLQHAGWRGSIPRMVEMLPQRRLRRAVMTCAAAGRARGVGQQQVAADVVEQVGRTVGQVGVLQWCADMHRTGQALG